MWSAEDEEADNLGDYPTSFGNIGFEFSIGAGWKFIFDKWVVSPEMIISFGFIIDQRPQNIENVRSPVQINLNLGRLFK